MVPPDNRYPVVILGGGFAGAYCARALAKFYGDQGPATTALLADQNFILFHPMLAEVSGSSISPIDVVNPLRRFCKHTSIFLGEVQDIDLAAKRISFSPGPFVREATLGFEHLVLAVGSVVDTSRVPGMAEHGFLFKNVGDAIKLKTNVLRRLEEAGSTPDESARKRLLTFVVVGGGYSGVETMGQLVDLIRGVHKLYPRLQTAEFRFVLVHSGEFLLPQIGKELGTYCEEQLRKRGVEILLNGRVTAITAERAILNGNQAIETNTVVTTVGNAISPIIKKLIDRYHFASDHGRLTTEMTMRLPGYENVWAAGDCAAVPDAGGQTAPATAQFAMRQGTVLGKNLVAVRQGRSPVPFSYQSMGEMASLGHMSAVGKVLGLRVSGFVGWLMWRATYLYKLPGLEQKLKVFIAWNLDLLFPRDISLLDIKPTEMVGRMHFETGDPVFHIGDPPFSFYLIEKGKISLSNETDPARTLVPGQHFGERELLENVRRQFNATAVEPSTLLAMDRHTFEALTRNSLAIGYFLNRSSVRYLTLAERKAIAERIPPEMAAKSVEQFARSNPVSLQNSSTVADALLVFHDNNAAMLPLVDAEQKPVGWLRLDVVFDELHLGKVTLQDLVSQLLILPAETVAAGDSIEAAALRFAQTPDRELVVADEKGRFTGTLRLLDLVVAAMQYKQDHVAETFLSE
jgi:NADH dehydrogenase